MVTSAALHRTWREFRPRLLESLKGYNFNTFQKDALAGITVGIVAIPLALAFAIASGVEPVRGLITAIVAGFLIALLGGSRVQVAGPTGAFIVIIYGVVERHGYDGLVIATIMAGLLLMLLGALRLGNLIKYIPYPVIVGFTAGIAVIIASGQLKDFFGLNIAQLPAAFLPKMESYVQNASTLDITTTVVSLFALFMLIFLRNMRLPVPPAIIMLVVVSVLVWYMQIPVATIGSKFGGIPQQLPSLHLPTFDWTKIPELVPDALTIAFLAGVESLLSAMVADGLSGDRHKPNTELIAQGVGNIASALTGGISATGAIARTGVNINSGAKTPISSIIHAIFLLGCMLVLAPLASAIPLAALAAVLVMVSWDMSERRAFAHLLKAPKSDVMVLLATFGLTVMVDLTLAVEVGVIMAAILFVRRMTVSAKVEREEDFPVEDSTGARANLNPEEVQVFTLNGPFFFGMIDQVEHLNDHMETQPKVLVLNLSHNPAVDASAVRALRTLHKDCKREGSRLVLANVHERALKVMARMGLTKELGEGGIQGSLKEAVQYAREVAKAE